MRVYTRVIIRTAIAALGVLLSCYWLGFVLILDCGKDLMHFLKTNTLKTLNYVLKAILYS